MEEVYSEEEMREMEAIQENEERLMKFLQETGKGTMQVNGQRIIGGPPANWSGPPPSKGCEVFVGKIPRDVMEDELFNLFSSIGTVYELRLMMDFSGCNRGFAFIQFACLDDVSRAIKLTNNYELRPRHRIGVVRSKDNCRLFIGGIPKNKKQEEIQEEIQKLTEGVRKVIVYSSITDKTKNRGFAFVEYDNHRLASKARRKLIPDRIHLWGKMVAVDWAEPEPIVEECIMSQVTVLYVRNLSLTSTEQGLFNIFNAVSDGHVTKVKMMRDFAFVHFTRRSQAEKAMAALDRTTLNGTVIEISWAKPVKEKEKNEGRNKNSTTMTSDTTAAKHSMMKQSTRSPSSHSTATSPPQSPPMITLPSNNAYQINHQIQQVPRGLSYTDQTIQAPNVKVLPALPYLTT